MHFQIRSRLRHLVWGTIAMAFCFGAWRTTTAQVASAAAALNGTVRDSSGAVVPGAKVVLKSTATGFTQTTKSNGTGNYSLVNIAPGNYVVTVSMTGFSNGQSAAFDLSVNQTATINFDLRAGTVDTTVTISAAAVQIETSTAELGTVIGSAEVNALPLNGRNFTEMLLLSP